MATLLDRLCTFALAGERDFRLVREGDGLREAHMDEYVGYGESLIEAIDDLATKLERQGFARGPTGAPVSRGARA